MACLDSNITVTFEKHYYFTSEIHPVALEIDTSDC